MCSFLLAVVLLSVSSEEEKCILVKVTTPGHDSVSESQNLTLASCTMAYFDVLNSRPVQHTVDCSVVLNPAISCPVTSDCVDDVEQHRLRCEVAEALGNANKMADTGNFAGARGLLQGAVKRVRGSRVCRQALAVHLLETLQESLEGIQDKVTFAQHGKAVILNYAGSHWQQRSNTRPSQEGYVRRTEMAPTSLLSAKSAAASASTDSYSPYRNSHKRKLLSHYTASKK